MLFADVAALYVVALQLHLVLEVRGVAVDVPESCSPADVLVSMRSLIPTPFHMNYDAEYCMSGA